MGDDVAAAIENRGVAFLPNANGTLQLDEVLGLSSAPRA